MKQLICLFSFVLLSVAGWSQIEIYGQLRDSLTGEAIPFSPFVRKGTTQNGQTDAQGNFKLRVDTLPITLVFVNVSYRSQTVLVSNAGFLNIQLAPRSYGLNTVEIISVQSKVWNEEDPLTCLDFDFYDDYVLQLMGNRNTHKSYLQLCRYDGELITSMEVPSSADSLYHDCMDAVQLMTKDSVYQIFYDYEKLNLLYATEKYFFLTRMNPCKGHIDQYFYFGYHTYKNQKLDFYTINSDTRSPMKLFCSVHDSEKINGFNTNYDLQYFLTKRRMGVNADGRYLHPVSYLKDSINSLRATEHLSYADSMWLVEQPVRGELMISGDTVFVFDFVHGRLWQFEKDGTRIKKVLFVKYHTKGLKNVMVQDYWTKQSYLWIERDGVSSFALIDRNTGNVFPPRILDVGHYVRKPKIRNGYVYFIDKDPEHAKTKKLTMVRL